MRRALLLLLSLFVGGRDLVAELVWDAPKQEFTRSPKDQQISVDFSFKNTGAAPVTITDIKSSCGCCTTVSLQKKTYQPGETGRLGTKFVFGGRRGLQSKTITVATSDGKREQLSFECNIVDDPVTLSASVVNWRIGEEAVLKTVQVTVSESPAIEIIAVASSSPHFAAELVPAGSGERRTVRIRPAGTAKPESAEIFVQTNYPPEGPKAYTIRARIQ